MLPAGDGPLLAMLMRGGLMPSVLVGVDALAMSVPGTRVSAGLLPWMV